MKKVVITTVALSLVALSFYCWRQNETIQSLSGQTEIQELTVSKRPVTERNQPASSQNADRPKMLSESVALSGADADKRAKEVELREIRRGREYIFGKAILALKLSPSDAEKLMEFLVERSEAIRIAQEVYADAKTNNPAAFQPTVQVAVSDVDAEIRQAFGDEMADKIAAMIESSSNLLKIQMEVDPALVKEGLSATTPEQTLGLANMMRDIYGPANENIHPQDGNIDAVTHLTSFDLTVIQRTANILEPEQVPILRQTLAARNLTILRSAATPPK